MNHPERLTQFRIHSKKYKARRLRQRIELLRLRIKAIRLGYPLRFYFALTWIAQVALLLLPASATIHLFIERTVT
jgi:hypothetical protein